MYEYKLQDSNWVQDQKGEQGPFGLKISYKHRDYKKDK